VSLTGPCHFSNLKRMAMSPAHYKASVEIGFPEKSHLRKGSGTHALILGGDFVVWPGTRRGKDWEQFELTNAGRLILNEKEHEACQAMANAVKAHPNAMRRLEGEHEKEIIWTYLGRTCSSRLDVRGDSIVTELKTTKCAQPERFIREALRYGYNAQLAFYREAAMQQGHDIKKCYIVAVESAPPYSVVVFPLSERALTEGLKMCHGWMETLLNCERSNAWPDYVQCEVELDVPEESGIIVDGEEVELE
jgi:hypothetical protein